MEELKRVEIKNALQEAAGVRGKHSKYAYEFLLDGLETPEKSNVIEDYDKYIKSASVLLNSNHIFNTEKHIVFDKIIHGSHLGSDGIFKLESQYDVLKMIFSDVHVGVATSGTIIYDYAFHKAVKALVFRDAQEGIYRVQKESRKGEVFIYRICTEVSMNNLHIIYYFLV